MILPKTITLRLTKAALAAVPDMYGEKAYTDNHKCLICQAVRLRFPGIFSVNVFPGWVRIDDVVFGYSKDQHEEAIVKAHSNPDKFEPFSIRLTRE